MKTRQYPCKVLRIVDGDTFIAEIDLGFYVRTEQRVRVVNVDAPEKKKGEVCEAEAYLQERLPGREFMLTCFGKDKYGRWIADLDCEGTLLSKILLEKKYAEKYPK